MEEAPHFGPFTLDRKRGVLLRVGQPVAISRRAYLLLEMLVDAGGTAVAKDDLMAHAWPGAVVEEANLTVQISTLRRSLGDVSIVTVPRFGYRLDVPSDVKPSAELSRPSVA